MNTLKLIFCLFFCQDIYAAILKGGVLINKKTGDYLVVSCSRHNCDELSLDLYQNNTMTFSTPLPSLEKDFNEILFAMIAYRKTFANLYRSGAFIASVASSTTVSYGVVYQIFKRSGIFASISNPRITNFKQFIKLTFSLETRRLFMSQIRGMSSMGAYLKGYGGGLAAGFVFLSLIKHVDNLLYFSITKNRFVKHLDTLLGRHGSIETKISEGDFIVINSILTRYSEIKNKEDVEEELFEAVLN